MQQRMCWIYAPEFKFKKDGLEFGLIKTGIQQDVNILEKLEYRPTLYTNSPIPRETYLTPGETSIIVRDTNFRRPFNTLISVWNSFNFLDYSGDLDKIYLTNSGRSAIFEELKKYEPQSLLAVWKTSITVWENTKRYRQR